MEPNKFAQILGEAEMAAEEAGGAMATAEELGETGGLSDEQESEDITSRMSDVVVSALRAIVINKGVWYSIDDIPEPTVVDDPDTDVLLSHLEIVFVIDTVGEVMTMVRDQWSMQDIYDNDIVGWAPVPDIDELLLETNS